VITDRELLEAAAKAAGIEFNDKRTPYPSPALYCGVTGSIVRGWWNPLTDDGDALRLAVKLTMRVTVIGDGMAEAKTEGGAAQFVHDAPGYDTVAAARRAIVRAAAAMASSASSSDAPPQDA
jgi:hypothetical protein